MSRKNIWILISSRKGGHTYPGRAISSYILARDRGMYPQMINVLDLSWLLSLLDRLGRLGDLNLKRMYRFCYNNLRENNHILKSLYRFIGSMIYHYGKVKAKLIKTYGKPDLIISIQPEVNSVAHLFKLWFHVPFHSVIIDLAIHGLWVSKCVDNYYVASEPLKHELMEYSVAESRIKVTGMPLRNGFAKADRISVKSMRRRLGLSPDLNTVLLLGGLLGRMVDFSGVVRAISDSKLPIQIVTVFGANDAARNSVQGLKKSYKYPLHLYGTVANMHELMWASDVVISKPGSVTMTEVLSLGKPLVVMNPLAGSAQELRFAQYLEENEAGFWIKDANELVPVLNRIMGDRAVFMHLSRNARKLGQHGLTANHAILEDIKRSFDKEEA